MTPKSIFTMIDRLQKENILRWMGKRKAVIIIGPRQVGKTTLTQQISDGTPLKKLWLTGDDPAASGSWHKFLTVYNCSFPPTRR